MLRIFDVLIMLYPANYRVEFSAEMRSVFLALADARKPESGRTPLWFALTEIVGLIRGAAYERGRQVLRQTPMFWQSAISMAVGTVLASGMHLLMYRSLVPIKGKSLGGVLEHFASHLFILCVFSGIAAGQQPARQDPAVLEIAKSIYGSQMTALREAKTLDDMKKNADRLDSSDWISVDRFGRTVLTRQDADRELASMLAIPPAQRVAAMDIIWAEQNSDRLIVVAWMMPNEVERIDSEGDYGFKGIKHKLVRGTLIRDVFQNSGNDWHRIRHDKILPNDTVLAVDGVQRIVPPLDEKYRVAPSK
jgi:hypothetical protein